MSTAPYNTELFSSPPQPGGPGTMYTESARSKLRALKFEGRSTYEIIQKSKLRPSAVKNIINASSTHSVRRKGKKYKPKLLSTRDLRQIIRWISVDYGSRRRRMHDIKSQLSISASGETIRRVLQRLGYRRCIACPRPFISKKAAAKRLAFAQQHRWWGTSDAAAERASDWRKVVWSDECIFETGKTSRQWVTRRPDEKKCPTCIKSVYRSGRTTCMVWGAIGWDWKSPLVFMEGHPDSSKKGISALSYLDQVLKPVIFPHWATLVRKEEWIYMEDGAPIHKKEARLVMLNSGIRTFS